MTLLTLESKVLSQDDVGGAKTSQRRHADQCLGLELSRIFSSMVVSCPPERSYEFKDFWQLHEAGYLRRFKQQFNVLDAPPCHGHVGGFDVISRDYLTWIRRLSHRLSRQSPTSCVSAWMKHF